VTSLQVRGRVIVRGHRDVHVVVDVMQNRLDGGRRPSRNRSCASARLVPGRMMTLLPRAIGTPSAIT